MGKVFFVGSGLGSLEYLTVWGRSLLSSADVVMYDALGSQQLLDLVPEGCLQVYVGKRGGEKSTPQDEINRLLVEYGQLDKQVVRLKGGGSVYFWAIAPRSFSVKGGGL